MKGGVGRVSPSQLHISLTGILPRPTAASFVSSQTTPQIQRLT